MGKNTKASSRVSIKRFQSVDFRTLADDLGQRDDWLVEPLIPARRSTAIVAKGGVGKSLVMLEICAALATGRETLLRPSGPPIPSVYIDMEMTLDDLAERLTAMGYDFTNDAALQENLHYYQLQTFRPFDTPAGGKELLAVAGLHQAELVVIDTLAGVVEGEENSADTFRAYARHTGKPLKATGVPVVRLDHAGRDEKKGGRGSSAKRDDVDVVWLMTTGLSRSGGFKFARDKSRMGWVPKRVDLVRKSVTPLRHDIDAGDLTEKQALLVKRLDELGTANDVGRPKAKQALTDVGVRFSTGDLSAAVAFRKRRSGQVPGQDSWKTTGQGSRTGGGDDV